MSVFKYGSFEFDSANVPTASVDAMIRRGFAHYMGSECSSKVTGAFEDGAPEGYDESDESRAKYKGVVQAAAFQAFLDGKVGAAISRGPKVDPLTAAFNAIVKREVTDKLKTMGLKYPKGDEVITFADGSTRTAEAMLANWGKNHGERIKKEAERVVREAEKRRKALEAATAEASGKGAEEAGL